MDPKSGIRLIDHGLIRLDHSVQDVGLHDDIGIHDLQASPVDSEDPMITPPAHLEIRDTSGANDPEIAQGAEAIAILYDATTSFSVYLLNGNLVIGDTTVTADGGPVSVGGYDASLNSAGLVIAGQTFTPSDPQATGAPSSPASQTAPVDQGSAPSAVFSPNSAAVPTDGSAPTGALSATGGPAPTGGSAPSTLTVFAPASQSALGSGSNGSFVAAGTALPAATTGAVKQVATAFSQFSDESLISNEAPDVGVFSLPLVGIMVGVFVVLLV